MTYTRRLICLVVGLALGTRGVVARLRCATRGLGWSADRLAFRHDADGLGLAPHADTPDRADHHDGADRADAADHPDGADDRHGAERHGVDPGDDAHGDLAARGSAACDHCEDASPASPAADGERSAEVDGDGACRCERRDDSRNHRRTGEQLDVPGAAAASLTTIAVVASRGPARARTVMLLVPLRRAGRVEVVLVGPSPSCVTARTIILHGRKGANRLRLGPAELRGLKAGRYLIRVSVYARSKALQTTMTITRDRRIVTRGKGVTTAERVCATRVGAGAAAYPPSSATAVPNLAAAKPSPQGSRTPGHSTHRHGLRSALGHTTAQIVDAVEQPAWTVLAFLFVCLILLGGGLLVFPLARLIRERHVARHS